MSDFEVLFAYLGLHDTLAKTLVLKIGPSNAMDGTLKPSAEGGQVAEQEVEKAKPTPGEGCAATSVDIAGGGTGYTADGVPKTLQTLCWGSAIRLYSPQRQTTFELPIVITLHVRMELRRREGGMQTIQSHLIEHEETECRIGLV